ncbi:hypothetical protein QT971_23785 [Microcoleus sp. herbarium19]|uniref:hypothetical protein n=1 Tax=unclassified Microcoleus TaxID=2642155 RepID=UPI002FCEB429
MSKNAPLAMAARPRPCYGYFSLTSTNLEPLQFPNIPQGGLFGDPDTAGGARSVPSGVDRTSPRGYKREI